MKEGEDAEKGEGEKLSRSTWLGETTSSGGLIDVEDGSVAVDLPNLGAQHVFTLTGLCFHCRGIFGLEVYRNSSLHLVIYIFLHQNNKY